MSGGVHGASAVKTAVYAPMLVTKADGRRLLCVARPAVPAWRLDLRARRWRRVRRYLVDFAGRFDEAHVDTAKGWRRIA